MPKETNKNLYKGIVNWYGELHTIYTHANSVQEATRNICKQLQKRGIGYAIPYIFNKLRSDHSGVQFDLKLEVKDETRKNTR